MLDLRKYPTELIASAVGLILLALSIGYEFGQPINGDVATFIYRAQEYLFHGKIPYRDIIDINPPFGLWLFMPPIVAAHELGWSPNTMITASLVEIYVLMVISSLVSWLVFTHAFSGYSKAHKAIIAGFFIFLISVGSAGTLGQRDHLIFMFLLPEILLSCAASSLKASDQRLAWPLRFAAGFLAWSGIAMKPHHILTLLLPELVVLIKRRSMRALFRPETVTLLVLSTLYVLVILLHYPAMLHVTAPIALHYYKGMSIFWAKWEVATVMYFITILLLRILFYFFGKPAVFDPLLAGICGGYLAYLAQNMGFGYQRSPYEGLMGVWLLLALPPLWPVYSLKQSPSKTCNSFLKKYNIRFRLISLAVLACCLFVFTWTMHETVARARAMAVTLAEPDIPTSESEYDGRLLFLLKRYAGPGPVLFLIRAPKSFPSILYADLELAGRWEFLWPLRTELEAPPEQRGMLAKSLAEDIQRDKPTLILIDPACIQLFGVCDIVKYFNQWPEFRAEWKNYQRIDMPQDIPTDGYILYRRT